MHISGTIHHAPDPDRACAFRIAEDASLYTYRKDAARAKSLTAQASALSRANQDASNVWAQASEAWRAINMNDAAEACSVLAGGREFNDHQIAAE